MRTTTVNEDALVQATTFLVGPEATAAIIGLYQLIDLTQKQAYDLGVSVGMSNVEDATNQAWDAGYDAGEEDGLAEVELAGDNGYIAGVADARAHPAQADENVSEILAYQAEQEYDEDNVQDSGDEQPVDVMEANGWCSACQSFTCVLRD